MAIMTKETAEQLFGDLWTKMVEGEFGQKLKENEITIKYEIHDPEMTMYVDHTGCCFDEEAKPKIAVVLMKMSLDTAHKFWMKNVFFPIDIIWIDSNLSIVYIERNAPPCTTARCQIYTSPVTAKYVLEVMANFTEKYNIKVGDHVKIK